jgi:hypothetical protein
MARRFNRRPLSEAERAARRHADRERIEQAARALLTTEGWQRWIRVRASNGLSRYSVRNQWLIAIDCHARGDHADLRRRLPRLPHPQPLRAQGREGDQDPRTMRRHAARQRRRGHGRPRISFRVVPVFDVAMAEPLPGMEPVSLVPPAEPIEGDSHRHLIAPLQQLGRELGYAVEIRELPDQGPGGWCDPNRRQIVVASGPANRQVRTLVHELAHALGIGYEHYGREQAEVLVDCVTYIVCSSVGLDVGGESIPYIAGWGEEGALDAIRAYAETIDTIARRIEDALHRAPDTPPVGDAIGVENMAA